MEVHIFLLENSRNLWKKNFFFWIFLRLKLKFSVEFYQKNREIIFFIAKKSWNNLFFWQFFLQNLPKFFSDFLNN